MQLGTLHGCSGTSGNTKGRCRRGPVLVRRNHDFHRMVLLQSPKWDFCGTGSGDVPEDILGRKRSPPFWGASHLLLEGVAFFSFLLSLLLRPLGAFYFSHFLISSSETPDLFGGAQKLGVATGTITEHTTSGNCYLLLA